MTIFVPGDPASVKRGCPAPPFQLNSSKLRPWGLDPFITARKITLEWHQSTKNELKFEPAEHLGHDGFHCNRAYNEVVNNRSLLWSAPRKIFVHRFLV